MRYYTQNTASFEMVAIAARCVSPDKARGLEILDEANGGGLTILKSPGCSSSSLWTCFLTITKAPKEYERYKDVWLCICMYIIYLIFIDIDMYTFVHCMYTHIYLVYTYCVFACYMPEIWPSCRMLWQERWESMHTCSSFFLYYLLIHTLAWICSIGAWVCKRCSFGFQTWSDPLALDVTSLAPLHAMSGTISQNLTRKSPLLIYPVSRLTDIKNI